MTVTAFDILTAIESHVASKLPADPDGNFTDAIIKFDDVSVNNLDQVDHFVRIDYIGEVVRGGRTNGRLGRALVDVTYFAKDNTAVTKQRFYKGSKYIVSFLDNANVAVPATGTVIRIVNIDVNKLNHEDGYRQITHRCECQFITS